MYVIYCIVKKGRSIVKFLAFDSNRLNIVNVGIDQLICNINQFYGVSTLNNKIIYNGYNMIPCVDADTRDVDINRPTLVGVINNGIKRNYVMIWPNGAINQLEKHDVIAMAKNGAITNVIKSESIVRMKHGKMPILKSSEGKRRDTVKLVMDVTELSKVMSTLGVGVKFLGQRIKDNKIGMVKKSTSLELYDNINEVLCYHLGKLFGVRVCEASFEVYKGSNKWVMSHYEYDFGGTAPESCKDIFGLDNFHNRFSIRNIESLFGIEAVEDFNRMVIFDLLTNQTDRHVRNFAFYRNRLYPLYDNGRCLFWDRANLSPIKPIDLVPTFYTNEHGYGWSYIDGVLGPSECRRLINPSVQRDQIYSIVSKFYKSSRSEVLTDYIYMTYKIITGGYF